MHALAIGSEKKLEVKEASGSDEEEKDASACKG